MEVGLFPIHAVMGSFVAAHGSQKLFGILGGYGLEGTGRSMEGFGLRPGKLFAFAAGSAELVGGLAFAAGFLTRVAAALIVAARSDHAGKGFWIYKGGYEYVLTNTAVVIALAFHGAGEWSADNAIGWDVAGVAWGLGALAAAVIGAGGVLALRASARSATVPTERAAGVS